MTIFLTALLAGTIWNAGVGANDPVDLPVMFDAPYVLHTEITKSVRRDAESPVNETRNWEVRVSPKDEGFLAVWRDLDKRQDVVMEIETDERLIPVSVANLPAIRRAMVESVRADDKDTTTEQAVIFLNALPERTLMALMTQDAMMIALGQGQSLAVGTPHRYSTRTRPFENGPEVVSEAAYDLESFDEAAGRAVVVWSAHVDEKALSSVMPDLVRAAMAAMGLDATDQDKVAVSVAGAIMIKTSRCRYQIVIETGLAETVSCVTLQDIRMLDQHQKTETRFEATQTLQ